jgi:VCBS repeat protein
MHAVSSQGRRRVVLRLRVVRAAAVVWFAWASGLAGAFAGPPIDLGTRRSIPMTEDVRGAAVGDFDEDGIPDIATVHLTQGVELYHGLGSARFEISAAITTTGNLLDVVAADLDHDGHIDLVMTGMGPAVTVLLGYGTGEFQGPFYYGTTQQSNHLVVADLDGDAHPDVALTHASTSTIDVFRGTGTGAFAPASPIAIPATSSSGIVAGDFNGDGKVDLAAGVPSGIVFIPGNGPLDFGAPVSSSLGSGAGDLTSADFDADGVPDLATTGSGSALVLHGIGDGHFTLAQTLPVDQRFPSVPTVTSGDLNSDGRPDLVVGSYYDVSTFVFLATGPGQFSAGVPYQALSPNKLLIADLDQDGRQDLLAGGFDLSILRGDGLGRFVGESSLSFPWPVPDIGAADFDGDGMSDLVVLQAARVGTTECYNPQPGPIDCGPNQQVLVLPGIGQALFGTPISTPTRCGPGALAIADFNGDGRPDIAIANRGAVNIGICYSASLSVFVGDGDGHFVTFAELQVPSQPDDIVAGDFDEDGIPDLAVAYGNPGRVAVYRLAPGPALVPAGTWSAPASARYLAAGDLNRDSHLDLAVALSSGDVAFLRGDGTGQIALVQVCAPDPAGGTGPVLIGDFDGNGIRDIAAVGSNSVHVMPFIGAGDFCGETAQEIPIPAGAYGLGMGDLNADGVDDLLVTDGYGRVSAAAANPTLPWTVDVYGAWIARPVTTADFDADGLPDVAVANADYGAGGTGLVSVARNVTPAAPRLTLRVDGSPMAAGPSPAGSGSSLFWTGVLGATGYDVVRGSLAALRTGGGDFTSAVDDCLANDLPFTRVDESENPPAGDGWWFLARPLFPAGPGSYDGEGPGQVGSRDAELRASPLACP